MSRPAKSLVSRMMSGLTPASRSTRRAFGACLLRRASKRPLEKATHVDAKARSLESHLEIPICDADAEEIARRMAQEHGQFLARQDRWDELADALRAADAGREVTPAGIPLADLMAFGARSDVVHAVEHALMYGAPPDDAPITAGIAELEYVYADHAQDPMIAMVVALAHIDLAWAWRGAGWEATLPQRHRDAAAMHFERAGEILAPYHAAAQRSPILAAAQCALLPGQAMPQFKIADTYHRLIDLDPANHRHMRVMGTHLLPRWFGNYDLLELEARRAAARTKSWLGHGGYTWVQFDAIALDDVACERVDVPFFIDGLRDIVAHRPDQAMINMLAAYCSVALPQGLGLNEKADLARAQIIGCAKWLIRDHLTEVHPLLWAHAAEGFDTSARVTSLSRFAQRGKADALRAIAEQFGDDIANGNRVTFTADGPKLRAL